MTAIVIVSILFIGLPWIVLHHVSRWKTQGGLTKEDEKLLDELYELGRKLEERVTTIERIMQADNPGWRNLSHDAASIGIEDKPAVKGIVR